MAKPSSKPAKKGQTKAKAVPASKIKTIAKTAVKAVAAKPKAVPKAAALAKPKAAVPAKKVVAAKVVAKAAKPLSAKAKPSKAVSKPIAKVSAKPSVKVAKKAVAKPARALVKVKAVEPKVVAKAVVKGHAKANVKPVKVAKAAEKVTPPKKVAAQASVAPLVVKGKQAPKNGKVSVAAQPEIAAESLSNQKKAVHASSKALARTLAQLPPPPPPPPMLPEPQRHVISPAALKAFEQAVKVFNRQHYEDAKRMFESLEEKYPLDGEIIGRAQIYLQACAKKLSAVPEKRPFNADELYDQGVHALNNGDYATAKQFFEKALKLNPNEPDFLYSLAAVHAQTGAPDEALDLLARSIQVKPRFRTQAFEDTDFSGLRGNRQFMQLLGLTSPFERLEQRR